MPAGHPSPCLTASGTAGSAKANCSARSIISSGQASGGKWVIPMPSTSPTGAVQPEHAPSVAVQHLGLHVGVEVRHLREQ